MLDPLSLPAVALGDEAIAWLVEHQVVKLGPISPLAAHLKSGAPTERPPELARLGLDPRVRQRDAEAYQKALQVLAAPDRVITVASRALEHAAVSTFYLRGADATFGGERDGKLEVAGVVPALTLCSAFGRKLTGDGRETSALLPELLGALGRVFLDESRTVGSRRQDEVLSSAGEAAFSAWQKAQVLVQRDGRWRPSDEYALGLEAMWSGHVMLIEVRTATKSEPEQKLSFLGPEGMRVWTFDERLPDGRAVSVFRALSAPDAAELAGAIVGV